MQYFVTLYIHPVQGINIPHAFLGLTHTHPDELDKLKDIDIYKYQVGYYSDKPTLIHVKDKWYNNIYPSILDSNFGGEGFFGFAPVESTTHHWGKVFENNQYIPKWHDNFQQYTYIDERPSSTFWQQNRCVFEISQKQYETLLESIKEDVEKTIKRTPILTQDDSKMTSLESLKENLYYNSTPIKPKFELSNWLPPLHNCVTWVLNKLDSIGIEVFNIREWIPDAPVGFNLKNNLFKTIKTIYSTFLKFQAIDDNLKSVKGAKAFKYWARQYINHSCLSQVYLEYYNEERNKTSLLLDKEIMKSIFHLGYVYITLDKMLQSRLDKLNNKSVKGDFELIYFDKQDKKIKILKAQNSYEAIEINNFDLSSAANNCSISKFYPFIFIPKDTMISRILYNKYDYGKVSMDYQNGRNEFYYNVLAGIQSDKYWSSSYHKLCKIQTKG